MARKDQARKGIDMAALAAQAVTALLLGGLAALAVFGTPALQARVSRSLAAAPVRVEFDWPRMAPGGPESAGATWLSPDIQSGLISAVIDALRADPDPLSVRALQGVGAALVETGWFERLDEVRREAGGVVRVRGTWRVPGAVVRHGGLDHLVSRAGEVLAPTYLPGQSAQRVVLGASTPPPSRNGRVLCGAPWGGGPGKESDVQAGVALLNLVATRPWRDQVSGVDAAAYAKHRRLELVTTSGTRVVWGGSLSEQVFGEPSVETKLWRVAELNRRFGRIDGGRQRVDISGAIATIDESPAPPPAHAAPARRP